MIKKRKTQLVWWLAMVNCVKMVYWIHVQLFFLKEQIFLIIIL